MERIKRQQTDTIEDHNDNKKQKLHNQILTINTNKSIFEDLANETVYEIFEYLDINDAYEGFFNLNQRFQNLFIKSNLPIQVNISTISKSKFEHYHKNIILPNKHRINILRLSNPFTVDINSSAPRILCKFVELETLILDNIKAKYLKNILKHSILLPKLHSLELNLADYIQDPSQIFVSIFRLPKLKSCKITYQIKDNQEPSLLFLNEYKLSPIEHLVINSRFLYNSLDDLLFHLPKLRYLPINSLVATHYLDIDPYRIALKHLKYVSLKLQNVRFNQLEKLIKYFFRHIEVLRLTTRFDEAYLDAKKWEELIVSCMPNLRIFDINHDGPVRNNSSSYHDLITQFNSSFWIEREWFFTHQHDWQERLDSGVFHSTDPYRRKDYIFYWELDKEICSHIREHNLTSVKHVYICSQQATETCVNYFPNATELRIENYFETASGSIASTLNLVVSLNKITKLIIDSYDFPFEEIVKLIYFTPNLHTLKLDLLSIDENPIKIINRSGTYQYVSDRNKIENFEVRERCTLEIMELIVNLFPQLEYFKTGIQRTDIVQIMQYLLPKNNKKSRHLFFLCIYELPKICLREVNMLIKFEKLLDDYFIKFVNRDLYLWW